MPHPTNNPEHLGSACWEKDRPDLLISTAALVNEAHTNSFLACHSPIESSNSNKENLSEAEVFEQLFSSRAYERLIIVTGGPGSGKSHFINWLKLRLDDALARGEQQKIKSVMIKRRSGSLRDALEQLVEQLPDFHDYLDPIRAAIAKLTSEYAKRELCFKLSQLLHQNRLGDRRLEYLHDFFSDPSSLEWLCREGGTVDLNIQRLISQNNLDERGELLLFNNNDLLINDPDLRRRAGQPVQEFLDNINADTNRCGAALSHANSFLRSALEMLTGLGNKTLHQIFRLIRQDLKEQGQSLALFIEDVSTLSALDTEVVNALEPQNDPSLCRLYSVLGMTNQALERLPQNMRERVNLELAIKGGEENGAFQTDPNYIDLFVARYLNALRLSSQDIESIAQDRRDGFDVRLSACEGCKVRTDCFNVFGNVIIGGQEIGLFPFRPGTAHRLLNGLSLNDTYGRTLRGLLISIVTPVVNAIANGVERAPINMGVGVDPIPPRDLDAAAGRYLGGWDERSKKRLNYLLWYWAGSVTLENGASVIAFLREAFKLPALSLTPTIPTIPEGVTPAPTVHQPPPPQDSEYDDFHKRLERWSSNNEPLERDSIFREFLLPLVKKSIPWDDLRQPFDHARQTVSILKTSAIMIDGMRSNPVNTPFKFPFLRSESTTTLLRAGLAFKFRGNNTWDYPESVTDRRNVGQWIRANIDKVVVTPDPVGLDPRDAHSTAIHFLLLAYQFCQRRSLPNDYSEVVNELFSFDTPIPMTISQELRKVAQDLPNRVTGVRKFLSEELNIPQGTGGILFIDPLPIIAAIQSYRGECSLNAVDSRFGDSFWAPRFKAVVGLSTSSWMHLEEALTEEESQINSIYTRIKIDLANWDLTTDLMPDRIEEFVKGCQEVKLALKETKQPVSDPLVETILSRSDNPIAKWKSILGDVEKILESGKSIDTLRFRTEYLIDLRDSVEMLAKWTKELDGIIERDYKSGTGGGDLDEEIKNAQNILDTFSALSVREVPDD